jgi:hypothetical protein
MAAIDAVDGSSTGTMNVWAVNAVVIEA